ncbi:SRPBCC family protein [Kribbia dieselivorans]|uniref:SRPBCC family protein n=1 Tax=Kribbia dieselivorans TaxID=331526 RepID=UPI0008399407|nr:SRPBCC domain-containing protein [Kribbia dieselivorans]
MTISGDTQLDPHANAAPDEHAIEVVQHVPRPLSEVWVRLTQPEGIQAWLGEGATLGGKGDPWKASDGTCGVTRSYHPEEQVRVSWHAEETAPPTVVDLQMTTEGEGTLLTLRHEHLPQDADRDALSARWDAAMHRLTQV